ncbi:MAG: oligosaccharide flippase family protein [Nitrospirota bacterium]
MTVVKRNIIANFVGQGWSALMALAFVPLYIKFLGIEAYGLIGFYAMLQGAFQLLDLGLSQTMNREMARYTALPEKAAEARDFVRTLEIGYWSIGLLIGIGVFIAAPVLAGHWIKPGALSVKTVQQALMIMGIVAALQWPLSFYDGGLMGLQKQVMSNVIRISMATLSSCGAALILWKVSPTITAFFTWQIIVNALSVTLFTLFLWRSLPSAQGAPRFNRALIRNVWRFAAGMSGISISAIILMQLDKLILSKLLSLETFGYYVLAGTACSVVPAMLVGPIFNALFPRFSSLIAVNDEIELTRLYHQGTQLMAVIVLPVTFMLAFYSYDILFLWTGSATAAREASPIISILILGMALNAFMTLPYALQLAHGWTSIGLRINIFLIIMLVPAIYFLTTHYGALGAATVWVILNSIYMIIGVPLTHQRYLKNEAKKWFINDIMPPLIATILAFVVGIWSIDRDMQAPMLIVILGIMLASTIGAAALAARHTRTWLFSRLFKTKTT